MDREKVIKAVEEAFDMYKSEYDGTSFFDEKEWAENKRDALALLNEQNAVKVQYTAMGGLRYGACPQCDARIDNLVNPKACGFCGQAVKWE